MNALRVKARSRLAMTLAIAILLVTACSGGPRQGSRGDPQDGDNGSAGQGGGGEAPGGIHGFFSGLHGGGGTEGAGH
jgi:hypothetical protein